MNTLFQTDLFDTLLQTQVLGKSKALGDQGVQVFETLGSTNDFAKQLLDTNTSDSKADLHGKVILAETQTQGRGTHGRVWESPPGKDLYFSLILQLPVPVTKISLLTLGVGLAVAETVEQFVQSKHVRVKWPNDVWINRKKCAGILVESAQRKSQSSIVVIGVGLNVNRTRWSGELDGSAISVLESMKNDFKGSSSSIDDEIQRESVLAIFLERMEHWLDSIIENRSFEVLHALRTRLALKDEWVKCDHVTGLLLGVDDNGALLIENQGHVHRLLTGRLEAIYPNTNESK